MLILACLTSFSVALPQTTEVAEGTDSPIRFSQPIRVVAGGKPIAGMYPSPRLVDIDGDGQDELVIADLSGRVKFAEKLADGGPGAWGELKAFETGERKLKFNNW